MIHARVISIENPNLDNPTVGSESYLHPKWVKRRQHVETCLLPQLKRFGFDSTEVFPAVTEKVFASDPVNHTVLYRGITLKQGNGVTGNFLSHYDLWELCISLGGTLLILEDDAILPPHNEASTLEAVHYYDSLPDTGRILYLQSQVPYLPDSLKDYDVSLHGSKSGPLIELVSCNDLSGTAAYCIKPIAAKSLIKRAHDTSTRPTDCFVHLSKNDHVIEIFIPKDYHKNYLLHEHWAAWNH